MGEMNRKLLTAILTFYINKSSKKKGGFIRKNACYKPYKRLEKEG